MPAVPSRGTTHRQAPPVARLALLLAALCACGSVEQSQIELGHPPAYARGYADGCESGKEDAGGVLAQSRKDASRYGTDHEYTPGWDAGFAQCRADTAAMVRDARRRNPSRDK
jgi:hypothetical protein